MSGNIKSHEVLNYCTLRLHGLLFQKNIKQGKKALKVTLFENSLHSNALATHLGLKFAQNFIQKSLQTSSFMLLPFNSWNLESSDLAAL